ncbi:MAG: GAF domain-containing protein [Actinomycetota bacterium]|nr:GAF domain-containing protein [Actinomycetota bacterium]
MLRRLLQAVLLIEADLELPQMLQRLVEEARSMTGARYGALGIVNDAGDGLSEFIVAGIKPEVRALIGQPPRGRGVLGLLLSDPRPIRLVDIKQHPASRGFPPNHPEMTSFLGVPVTIRGRIYGNLYLTDKTGWAEFTSDDEAMVQALAGAAGVAIEHAQLHELVRRNSVVADRTRISQDLHDMVIQRLFAIGLALEGLSRSLGRPDAAERLTRAVGEIDDTIRQIRTTIFELHSGEDGTDGGLREQVLTIVRTLAQTNGLRIPVRFDGPVESAVPDEVARHVLAVIREALSNVERHACAEVATVELTADGEHCTVTITDDGDGLPPLRDDGSATVAHEGSDVPADSSSGLGLANLRRRAESLGGTMLLEQAEQGGTRLVWRVPTSLEDPPPQLEEPLRSRRIDATSSADSAPPPPEVGPSSLS